MKEIRGRKRVKQTVLKILTLPLLVLVVYGAVRLGILGGNYMYNLNLNLVEKIDVNYFKTTLNTSLPIINTVYNSGNVGFSLADDLKKLLGGVFNVDMDYPSSIFNSQSSLFYVYYKGTYIPEQFAKSEPPTTVPDSSVTITPTPAAPAPGTGTQQGQGTGTGSPDTTTPDTTTPGTTTPGNIASRDDDPGKGGGTVTDSGTSLEPISSIVYEEEDEAKRGEGDMVSHEKISIRNNTTNKIDIEKLLSEPFSIDLSKNGPGVLIYHTHTRESYVLKASDLGKKNIPIYSNNPNNSVVRVGEELARNLKKFGINVLHNGTIHDYNHPSAYSESLKTLKEYAKSYPSLKLYFDIHRDGLAADQPKLRVTTTIGKKTAAQIMFVVGTGGTSLPHPNWKENLKFALKLQQKLNEKYPGLARPIYISKSRYNQHISNDALIVEIGGDGNLIDECVESTKYLAEAVNAVIQEN